MPVNNFSKHTKCMLHMLGRHRYLLYSPSNIPNGLGYEIEISVCIQNGKRECNGINKSHKKCFVRAN